MTTIESNIGFDGRTFLSEGEWRTYLRRRPVRFIDKKKDGACRICGKPGDEENPLQNAHRISFGIGVIYLALTPDFLDGDTNIVTAHRKPCNGNAELELGGTTVLFRELGVTDLPAFLPRSVHEEWAACGHDASAGGQAEP
jgi:hypothetical protein